MNGEYIKKLSLEEFHELALPYYKQVIKNPSIDLKKISQLLQTRVELLNEIPEKVDFFDKLPEYDIDLYIHKKMKTSVENSLLALEKSYEKLSNLETWTFDKIESSLMNLVKEMEVKNSLILWPVRTALSGKKSSPGGAFELAELLGKEESLNRIKIGIEKLANK